MRKPMIEQESYARKCELKEVRKCRTSSQMPKIENSIICISLDLLKKSGKTKTAVKLRVFFNIFELWHYHIHKQFKKKRKWKCR